MIITVAETEVMDDAVAAIEAGSADDLVFILRGEALLQKDFFPAQAGRHQFNQYAENL